MADVENQRNTINFKRLFPQAVAALTIWIITLEIGIAVIWSSPYIAILTAPDSPLPINLDEASWVAAILDIGRVIGAIMGSIVVNFIGSKKTCIVSAIPFAVGWIFTYLANSVVWLYAARVSLGMGFGFSYSCFALYLGEIATPKIRGIIVSFVAMGLPFGNLFGSLTGPNMNLQASSITYFVPCLLLIVLLSFLPDSPHHLVKIDKMEEARKSTQWYRGGDENIDDEFNEIVEFVTITTAASFKEKLAEFRVEHVRKATILSMMLFVFMQMCGLNTVIFYMETILRDSKSTLIEPSSAVTYVLICSVTSAITCVGLYDKFDRRHLFMFSSVGVSIALAALATHFALMERGIDWPGAQWLPIGSLFLFIVSFITGLNGIPTIVSSEVYAPNIKPIAACLANLTAATTAFAASKLYQPFVDQYGEAAVFYAHALFTIMAVPYTLLYMPETRGKSLLQIQNDLMKQK